MGVSLHVFVDDGAEVQLDILISRLNDARLGYQRTVKAHVFRRSAGGAIMPAATMPAPTARAGAGSSVARITPLLLCLRRPAQAAY